MAFVTNREYGQALTTTMAKRKKETQDIVYNATPLTRILLDSGRIQEDAAGGPELRVPVEFAKLKAHWFTGYDIIPMEPREILSSAVFNWSRVVTPFTLNGTELMYQTNEQQVINLMSKMVRAAQKSAKEAFEVALGGDGTLDGGRQMLGLGAAVPVVPNVGIYGGVDRATQPNWRTTTYNIPGGDVPGITSWDSTTARSIVNHITLARSRGSNYPKLWIADSLAYRAMDSATVAVQRIVNEKEANLGFSGIVWQTPAGPVTIVAAGGIGATMPANTIYGLDPETFSLNTFPGQDFVPFHPGEGLRPINQDAIAQGIVWSGQFVQENPLFNVRVITA